jgi:23S rRNA (uracil1939-C5)-methyltransferase
VLAAVGRIDGLSGLTIPRLSAGGRDFDPAHVIAGDPHVTDRLGIGAQQVALRRHVRVFFQGNRYLVGALVSHVVGLVPKGSPVLDLYAGAGLFAVVAAMARGARVTAVEGDRLAALDLQANAVQADGRVVAVHHPVETFVRTTRARPHAVILDPPRTGLSREALDGVARLGARTIVYVSCDVATLARDLRRLREAGYKVRSVAGFDMFPNTPHVETVVDMEKAGPEG